MSSSPRPSNPRAVQPIRLSVEETQLIRRAADRQGIPFSSYIRAASLKQAARDLKKAA